MDVILMSSENQCCPRRSRCRAFKVSPFLGWPILLPTTRDLCFAARLTTKQVGNRKGLGWNGVQSYSVSRLFEVDDFGYQITPITSPNYKTIWISSKHRVAFFNRFFWVIGNIGTVHSFLYIFVAIPSSDPKIGLAHIGDFAKNHPNQKATRSQTTKIPLSFRNLKESNNQNKAAHLFVACFPKEKLTAWWWT